MTELRKNEFKDLLEMNELLFIEQAHFIQADIPKLGNITYYPKSNKLQISNGNKWENDGYNYTKSFLKQTTKNLYTEDQLLEYADYSWKVSSQNINVAPLTPKEYFKSR